MGEPAPGHAATLGQVLHDALRESAVVEFGMPIESFQAWDQVHGPQRNRLETAAARVIAAAAPAVPPGAATGREAYETWRAAVPERVCNVPAGPWDELSPGVRAGFDAVAARQLQPAPERDRDRLRELLDDIGVLAANAPEDGDSFGVLEEIAMRVAGAGVPGTGHPGPELADDDEHYELNSVDLPSGERDVTEFRVVPASKLAEVLHVLHGLLDRTAGSSVLTGDEHDEFQRFIDRAGTAPPAGQPGQLFAALADHRATLRAVQDDRDSARAELATIRGRLAEARAAAAGAEDVIGRQREEISRLTADIARLSARPKETITEGKDQ